MPHAPSNPVEGVLDVLRIAAASREASLEELLSGAEIMIHGTTRSTNAVLTGTTAKTALLTTLGHRDVLLLREGGRTRPFDWSRGATALRS